MSAPVDVLAVMDNWLHDLPLSGKNDMRAAMDAVAELIVKADNAATALSNLIAARQADERYSGVVTDLTGALARVGAA